MGKEKKQEQNCYFHFVYQPVSISRSSHLLLGRQYGFSNGIKTCRSPAWWSTPSPKILNHTYMHSSQKAATWPLSAFRAFILNIPQLGSSCYPPSVRFCKFPLRLLRLYFLQSLSLLPYNRLQQKKLQHFVQILSSEQLGWHEIFR